MRAHWLNTGGNGKASAVWVRHSFNRVAQIHVMPYRYMVDLYIGGRPATLGEPFPTLTEAKRYADRFLIVPRWADLLNAGARNARVFDWWDFVRLGLGGPMKRRAARMQGISRAFNRVDRVWQRGEVES